MSDEIPPWSVTSQMETTEMGDSGAFAPGYKITFRTAGGVTGSVFVPRADYANTALVRERISKHAAELAAVSELRG